MSEKIQYGTHRDGKEVALFRLNGAGGTVVEIMELGAIIRAIKVPDRSGNLIDVVMGYENFEDQTSKMGWNGGIMGRVVNRIGDGKIWIHGKLHQLEVSEWGGKRAPFVMHGGAGGYAMKVFSGTLSSTAEGESVTFYHRDNGEGGFPGSVDVWVTYLLTPDNELQLRYRCLPTEDTILNITSHVYLNLAGHGNGTIRSHVAQFDCEYYTPAAPGGLPSGEVLSVNGTAFDFRAPKTFGEGLDSGDPQIALQGGYDHNLCLSGGGFRECGSVYEPSTGIRLTLSTDMPGVQLYCAGNEMPAENAKDGKSYDKLGAFCLETQYYPNATAHSHFPQPVFPGNVAFESRTAFKFSAE